jgi:hypothetical protein
MERFIECPTQWRQGIALRRDPDRFEIEIEGQVLIFECDDDGGPAKRQSDAEFISNVGHSAHLRKIAISFETGKVENPERRLTQLVPPQRSGLASGLQYKLLEFPLCARTLDQLTDFVAA